MKKIFVFIYLIGFSFTLSAQETSVKDAWKPLLSQPGLADYFSGIFESLGIEIEETGEKITVLHHGDHFEIKDGIVESETDYVVQLKLQNVKNLAGHGADGQIDDYESYKIMAVLFTPFTKVALENPMMNKSLPQKLAHIENHVHVYLECPTNDEFVAHTLIYLNKKWMVAEGIHGDALRTFRMSPDDAMTYQREVFKAEKVNTRKAWKKFMKFYLDWREGVSVKTGN